RCQPSSVCPVPLARFPCPSRMDYAMDTATRGRTRRSRKPTMDVRYAGAPWKGGAFQWVRVPPGENAPAGSNRSNCGGNEAVEASGDQRVTKYGDVASVQAVTRVNAEQASKRTMRGPTRPPFSGKADMVGGARAEAMNPAAAPGYWRQHVHKESTRNTGSPMAWFGRTNRTPAREGPGALG